MRGSIGKRAYCGLMGMMIVGMAFTFGACGSGAGEKTFPTPTERPVMTETPVPTEAQEENAAVGSEHWMVQLVQGGRTEISQDWTAPLKYKSYFKNKVSVTKTIRLGEFEYSLTAPTVIFRLENLQKEIDVIEVTQSLRYVGEKDSIRIMTGDLPFSGFMITDETDNWFGGGSYDVGCEHTLKKGEAISYTMVCEEYSMNTTAGGSGMMAGIVEFTVLDENGEDTDERYEYLLSMPYDVIDSLTPTPRPTEVPALTPTTPPEGWKARLIRPGRTEVSREITEKLEYNDYVKEPVSMEKTVVLGDFEFSVSAPQTIYGLEELRSGATVPEITAELCYVGDKESIGIACGETPFSDFLIAEVSGTRDAAETTDRTRHLTLKQGEPVTVTYCFEDFLKEAESETTGTAAVIAEFTVLDEERKKTEESYNYLLSLPFDVLE